MKTPDPSDPWLLPFEPMEEDLQVLRDFRRVAASLSDTFRSRRDHVFNLLGSGQNYSSGIFREGLLRDFLRETLPRAVDVNTGFIYGFEKVPNSSQLDILVWDSLRHSAVYKTQSFVIVPPESVIAVVSVKTGMEAADLNDAVENLRSVTPLDLAYRAGESPPLPPIAKFVVSFDGNPSPDALGGAVAKHIQQWFATDHRLADAVVPVLAALNPIDPTQEHRWQLDRVLPRLILSLASKNGCAFIRGWGPGMEVLSDARHGIRRVPYLYRLGSSLTTPLEKFVYHLLADVYMFLGTQGGSLVRAWGDFHPRWGFRIGDASEILEHAGHPLVDLESVLPPQADGSGTSTQDAFSA